MTERFRKGENYIQEEQITQLEQLVCLQLRHFFHKDGQFHTQFSSGHLYLGMKRSNLERISLWRTLGHDPKSAYQRQSANSSGDDYNEFLTLHKPDGSWRLDRELYCTGDSEDGSAIKMVDSSSSELTIESFNDLVIFKDALAATRGYPEKISGVDGDYNTRHKEKNKKLGRGILGLAAGVGRWLQPGILAGRFFQRGRAG